MGRDEQDLVGAIEAAAILGVQVRQVQRWAQKGKLVIALKLPGPNGSYLFERVHIEHVAAEAAPDGPHIPSPAAANLVAHLDDNFVGWACAWQAYDDADSEAHLEVER